MHFSSCDCWPQTSMAGDAARQLLMQRDSDTLIKTFLRQLRKSCKRCLKVHHCSKLVYSSIRKKIQNRCEWSACVHGAFSLWCRQWCSQNGNLRDRDLVKTLRPRLHQKSRGRDSRLQNMWILPKFSKKIFVIISKLNFFQISDIFPTCFGCFMPANTTNKNCWIIEILLYPFFAIFKVSIPELLQFRMIYRNLHWLQFMVQ